MKNREFIIKGFTQGYIDTLVKIKNDETYSHMNKTYWCYILNISLSV